jgi:hypothetical protein
MELKTFSNLFLLPGSAKGWFLYEMNGAPQG